MALTSSSTLAEAIAQYRDNLSWEGNSTKATAALEAVRFILLSRPQAVAAAGLSASFASLEGEKARLEDYVELVSSSVNRAAFTRGVMLTRP